MNLALGAVSIQTVLMIKLCAYITDEFGSLSCLPDVGTVGHSGVVQTGFSVLLVGNLRMAKEKN